MKKLIQATLVAVIMLALSVSTFAQPYGPGPKGDNPGFRADMAKALNLTDKQLTEIAKIKTDAQMKTLDLRNEIQKNRLKIKEEMLKDNPSKTVIKNLTDKITTLQGKIKDIQIDKGFKIYNLLDANQKKIAKTKMLHFGMQARGKMREKGFHRMRDRDRHEHPKWAPRK
jgi:Spy/CpxP family protein refolding chaperone